MGYGVYLTRFIRQGVALFVKKYRMFGLPIPLKGVSSRRAGVAIREVVVVIFVILIVFILGAPILLQMRSKSRRAACERNQRLVGFALFEYEQQHGSFPGYRNWQLPDDSDSRVVGWVFSTLPYLRSNSKPESPARWASVFDEFGPAGSEETRGKDSATRISMLLCPATPVAADAPDSACHFVVNGGLPDAIVLGRPDPAPKSGDETKPAIRALPDWPANGVFLDATHEGSLRTGLLYVQERDGADSTLLLSENTAGGRWSEGTESELVFLWDNARWESGKGRVFGFNRRFDNTPNSLETARASSFHAGGANVVFVSGATRFLSDSIDQSVFVALMTSENAALRVPGQLKPLPPPFGTPPFGSLPAKPGTVEPE